MIQRPRYREYLQPPAKSPAIYPPNAAGNHIPSLAGCLARVYARKRRCPETGLTDGGGRTAAGPGTYLTTALPTTPCTPRIPAHQGDALRCGDSRRHLGDLLCFVGSVPAQPTGLERRLDVVVSWQILEQETSISRRRSLAVVAKVRGGKRTSRALHRAANAGRVVPTTLRRRRRQRELDIHRGFRIEPPSTIARRRGPVRSQPHTERPAAQPRTAARCCVPGSWAGRDIKSQRTSGGVCLARQKSWSCPVHAS